MSNLSKVLRVRVDAGMVSKMEERLKADSSLKNISDLIRVGIEIALTSDQPALRKEIHEDLEAWRKEFHGVGSNLNQIAWRLNADQPISEKQIMTSLKDLKAEFKTLAINMKALRNDLDL